MASKQTRRQGSADTRDSKKTSDPIKEVGGEQTISGAWLLKAGALVMVVAVVCTWGALCLLFWQGSWQLLYHPTTNIERTPSSVGLSFDPVSFAATDEGVNRLTGWWVAAAPGATYSRFTVLFLHGQDGNLSDTVDAVAQLHAVGVNVLAFDYRGYGQSPFARPSEAHWREDVEWSLKYLTDTRHVASEAIVLDGTELGANLALEEAAVHPELGGVVVESPITAPTDAIFHDARAKLVPAHWLVKDRFDIASASLGLKIPSLLLLKPSEMASYSSGGPLRDLALKSRVKPLGIIDTEDGDFKHLLGRWLAYLPTR